MLSAAKANRQYFRQAYQTGRHGWPVVEEPPDDHGGFWHVRMRREAR